MSLQKMVKNLSQRRQACLAFFLIAGLMVYAASSADGQPSIHLDSEQKLATMSDGQGQLGLRLNYDGRCILDQVVVRGREVAGDTGVSTGVRMDGQWFTTHSIPTPNVAVDNDTLTV